MGVYIKGMEMPTSCAECRLMADGWCYSVGLEQQEKISTVKRPTWCPLVPVPPHGDLKDADELEVIGYCGVPQGYENTFDSGVMWLAEQIDKLPTIIPAEDDK